MWSRLVQSFFIYKPTNRQTKLQETYVRNFSDPVTDHKKKSKKGRLVLIKQDGEFQTVREEETTQEDEMFLVYENGELVKNWSLSEVRARAWSRKTKD